MASWDEQVTGEKRQLRDISKRAESPAKDLQRNLTELNQSVRYMSSMMVVMQNGIDDANRNIIEEIQDFLNDLIIIFGLGADGDTLDFDWGDLEVVVRNLATIFNLKLLGPGANVPEWLQAIWDTLFSSFVEDIDVEEILRSIATGIFKIPLWQLDDGGVEVIDSFAALSTVEAGEGWSWDDAEGHDEPGCALFTANGDQGTLTSPNPVQVREGEKYRASAWIKGTAASGGGAFLKVQWYDASHKAISSSTVAAIGTIISSWIKLEGTVTVPVGARWSRRVFEVNATSGKVRWDDVKFSGTATTIPQHWVENLTEIAQAIFSGWFGGGGGVGTPQEVKYTIESIKQAVVNGSIVDTMVVSGDYVVPECSELKAILIGGGQNGADGQPPDEGSSVKIAAGGLSGGFLAETLDAASLKGKTLSVTIGAPGSPTIIMNGGSEVARCDSGTAGGISVGVEGYTLTTSVPGNGGRGGAGFMKGWVSNTPEAASATPGTGSAKGTGGSAGGPSNEGTVGQPGTAGGNVSAGALTKCGGGGGGGGGEGRPLTIADKYDGGAGGPGGYPGGGGGGGGGAAKWLSTAGISGAGGIGAVGVVWFVWR